MEFTKPLSDQTVTEFETATFECEANKTKVKVTWLKDGIALTSSSDRCDMKTRDRRHVMTLSRCELSDASEICVKVDDVTSAAKLIVNG